MFTLLVSWLLATCIPVLLMLAMLGLGRLETALAHDAVTATDVAEFLAQAEAVDVHTLAREGCPRLWITCIAGKLSESASHRGPDRRAAHTTASRCLPPTPMAAPRPACRRASPSIPGQIRS